MQQAVAQIPSATVVCNAAKVPVCVCFVALVSYVAHYSILGYENKEIRVIGNTHIHIYAYMLKLLATQTEVKICLKKP